MAGVSRMKSRNSGFLSAMASPTPMIIGTVAAIHGGRSGLGRSGSAGTGNSRPT